MGEGIDRAVWLRANARLSYRPRMEFGLFYEIPVPQPWSPRAERDALHAVVAQAVRGEEAGASHSWTVEHQSIDEFSHGSAPYVHDRARVDTPTPMRVR